jgi:hypothetical protein
MIAGVGAGMTFGLLIGALVTAADRWLRGGALLHPRWAAYLSGGFSGAGIALLADNWHWLLCGAGFGAAAGALWPILCNWAESSLAASQFKSRGDQESDEAEEVPDDRALSRHVLTVDPSQIWERNFANDLDGMGPKELPPWPDQKFKQTKLSLKRRTDRPDSGSIRKRD